MKKLTQTLVVLALFGTICIGSGCDRFSDAAAEGLFGLVSEVAADLVSNILGLNSP